MATAENGAAATAEPIEASEAEIAKLKKTAEYKKLGKLYGNREWRLDNLYRIADETGADVPFVRNEAQRHYWANRWSRDDIVKARQLGFSTMIEIGTLDYAIFRENLTAGIVDATLSDARKKLAKIKFAYERMPLPIRQANPLVKSNTEEMTWANGSTVSVGTSYRGGTPQILHVSEYGRISVDKPEHAREIKTGSMQAVHATGWCVVESTAHGTAGEFYELTQKAAAAQKEKRKLTVLDYRLHFYGWWMKKEYRLPSNLVLVTAENREYFKHVNAILKERYSVTLDADQQAWYVSKLGELGPDDMFEEFPTIVEETFFNSIKGAFWKKEISRARQDGRIGQMVPFDPSRRVNTMWDIGEDCTAIIFHQSDGVRHRFIDYFEEEGGSLQRSATVLDEKKAERGFIYDKHIGPHDLNNRDWSNNATSRYDTALSLGIKFEVVPRIEDKGDSIEVARRFLNMLWIDSVHCSLLVERIENYRKKWNKLLQVYTSEPVHDMSSHGSDAVQQGAMYYARPAKEKPPADRSRPRPEPKRTSPWAN